jgi:hypothetical protein
MCAYTQPLDVTQLRYPELDKTLNHPGLQELVEGTSIAWFLRQIEDLNDGFEFTRAELQQCWFYALNKEYNALRDTKQLDTTERREAAEVFLQRGLDQVSSKS